MAYAKKKKATIDMYIIQKNDTCQDLNPCLLHVS